MPDTIIAPTIPSSAPAPQRRKRKAAKPVGPQAFAQGAIDAMLPFVNPEDHENIREDVARKDFYVAALPFFADFTIADAVATHATITSVRDSAPYGTGDRYAAACAALEILEDFICTAYPSGPECVAAMAHFATLTIGSGDMRVPGQDNFQNLLEHVVDGIGALRSGGKFRMAERFAVPNKRCPLAGSWLGRISTNDELLDLVENAEAAAD